MFRAVGRFTQFIPPTAKYFDTKICTFLQQASYMFRPFMAIISEEFDKIYFPDDGRKGKILVEVLLYDCIYFCFELLGSFCNKHCKITLVLLHPLIIRYFWTDFFDSVFWKSLHKSVKQLQVS